MRSACYDYIEACRGFFCDFIEGGREEDKFDDYVRRGRRNGTWGDDVEIQALSELYDRPVDIFYSDSTVPARTFHDEGKNAPGRQSAATTPKVGESEGNRGDAAASGKKQDGDVGTPVKGKASITDKKKSPAGRLKRELSLQTLSPMRQRSVSYGYRGVKRALSAQISPGDRKIPSSGREIRASSAGLSMSSPGASEAKDDEEQGRERAIPAALDFARDASVDEDEDGDDGGSYSAGKGESDKVRTPLSKISTVDDGAALTQASPALKIESGQGPLRLYFKGHMHYDCIVPVDDTIFSTTLCSYTPGQIEAISLSLLGT